ncbi:hypothetical protein CLIM01_12069 [Colletotrichum limetticola]|uniref:Uncharacterized protein n=1 Tax=Colletotrichum limetticola TaxID=1209924 RepID=A0ABQ9PFA4_9PEZI|nr:hypothetical protein CLIM01_12069 [Colletotrichum limetticola]
MTPLAKGMRKPAEPNRILLPHRCSRTMPCGTIFSCCPGIALRGPSTSS